MELWSNILFIWSQVCVHLMNVCPSCQMLHHVHLQVANCVCLLFGLEQVPCGGFIRGWKQLPAATENENGESHGSESKQ